TGVVLWELLSTYRHRTALRAEGKLPAARPRYGLARWIWFRPLTRLASLLALRDGYTTTDLAWQAALAAIDRYGSARNARKAVRSGRPVPRPEPRDSDEHDNVRDDEAVHQRDAAQHHEELRDVQARHADPEITRRYLERDIQPGDDERDTHPPHRDREVTEQPERDTATPDYQRDTDMEGAAPTLGTTGVRHDDDRVAHVPPAVVAESSTSSRDDLFDLSEDQDDVTVNRDEEQGPCDAATEDQEPPVTDGPADENKDTAASTRDGDRSGEPQSTSKGALIARMKTYARERAARGVSVTGADLDRQFGTRDYGRKVLRQLAAEPRPG